MPQSYGGDGFTGLPPKAAPQPGTGADSNGEIALDVDVSWPDPERFPPPKRGYPLVVFMHGCCAGDRKSWEADAVDAPGERWHYSNAWFASRGLRRAHLHRARVRERERDGLDRSDAARLAALRDQRLPAPGRPAGGHQLRRRRPDRHGGPVADGGHRRLLRRRLHLARAHRPHLAQPGRQGDARWWSPAPKYGWTDLAYSLVPNGTHLRDALPPTDPAAGRRAAGLPQALDRGRALRQRQDRACRRRARTPPSPP